MRTELESMSLAGANALSSKTPASESIGLPEAVLLLLASGMACLMLKVAGSGNTWILTFGFGLLACGVIALAVARPTASCLVMFALAASAMALEMLAVAGRGLYAASAGASLSLAGLELSGWPSGPRAGLIVTLAMVAGLVATCASIRSWPRMRDLPFDRSRGILGRGAIVLTNGSGQARAVVCGELWKVHAAGPALRDGETVRVIARIDDDHLIVKRVKALAAD